MDHKQITYNTRKSQTRCELHDLSKNISRVICFILLKLPTFASSNKGTASIEMKTEKIKAMRVVSMQDNYKQKQ